jgi:hypothetical protein
MRNTTDLINVMKKACPGKWLNDAEILKDFESFRGKYTGNVKDPNGVVHQVNSYHAFQVVSEGRGEVVTAKETKKEQKKEVSEDKEEKKTLKEKIMGSNE